MSLAAKKSVLAVALIALAAWPPVHMLLALRWDTDPWSLFGWGMYTMPKPVVQIDLGEIGATGGATWSPEVRAAAEAYRDRRRVFGKLAPPDALATLALASRPDLAGVVVRIRRLALDPASARFAVAEELHEQRR